MALTVTATAGGGTGAGMGLQVFVLTGASLTQTGATWVQSAAAAHNATASTTVTGSRAYGAVLNGAATTPTVVSAATALVSSAADAGHAKDYGAWKAASLTGTPGSAQFGFTDSNNGGIAGCEILPATALAEDASAPAFTSTTSATALTTASFSPPPGSLLVACVAANGATNGTVTMTVTGGGYAWTAQAEAHASNMKYAGVFTAVVPALIPVARPAQATRPLAARGRTSASPAAPVRNPGSGPPVKALPGPVQARFALPPRGRTTGNRGPTAALLAANNAESGQSSGTTVTTGNSGGTAGNAWSVVNIGASAALTYDSAHAAHGGLSYNVSTGGSAVVCYLQWSAPVVGTQPVLWFRQYLYFTGNPAANIRVLNFLQTTGTLCAAVLVTTTGAVRFVDAATATIFTTTATIPLGQWFRIEGYATGSLTGGQVSLSLYKTPDPLRAGIADSGVPTETDTSVATQHTLGPISMVRFGIGANLASGGPYWMDDLAVSNSGPIGPAAQEGAPSQGFPSRARVPQNAPRGRAAAGPGAALANAQPGPVFRLPGQPARAPVPQAFSKGRTSGNQGAPVRNPGPGPVTYPLAGPVAARFPLRPVLRGRTSASPGAPLRNPASGPVFRQAAQPCRAPSPPPHPRAGRASGNPGTPPANPQAGPPFHQATQPCQSRYPALHPRAGRSTGNPGAPPRNPQAGPPFSLPRQPCQGRRPLPPAGRCTARSGPPVPVPARGVPFPPWHGPVQARRPLPPKGRAQAGGSGAPYVPPVLAPGVVAVTNPNPYLALIAAPSPAVVATAPQGAGAALVLIAPAAAPPAVVTVTPYGAGAATVRVTDA